MGYIDTPYLRLFATQGDGDDVDLPLGSERLAIARLFGHYGFFMCNFINVMYLALVEGYALGNLRKNFAHKMCLFGCGAQVISCSFSLATWVVNQETDYNFQGATMTFVGFTFMNIAVSDAWFVNSDNRNRNWKIAAALWVLFYGLFIVSMWFIAPEKGVSYYGMLATPTFFGYQAVVMGWTYKSVKEGSIRTNDSVATKEQFERICLLTTGMIIFLWVLIAQSMPLLLYPSTGLMYTTSVVFCKFYGQLAFAATGGETAPLLG